MFPPRSSAADDLQLKPGAILRVVSDSPVRPSAFKPGASLGGVFRSPAYAVGRLAVPMGSRIDLTLGEIPKQKGPSRLRRAAILLAGGPRRRTAPLAAFVRSARLTLLSGAVAPVAVEVLDVFPEMPLPSKPGRRQKALRRSTIVLRLKDSLALPPGTPPARCAGGTVPAGTRARVMLLDPVSSSANRDGDTVRAQLLEPVAIDGCLALPESTGFEATVVRSKPPRWFSRSGVVGLSFRKAVLSPGEALEISAALTGAEAGRGGMRMDSEGTISGGSRSKKRAAVDLLASYIAGKVVDDLVEEGVKYIWGAAVSGAAATAARYVGLGTGALVFFGQRGRDARLPRYAELELTFSRPAALSGKSGAPAPR